MGIPEETYTLTQLHIDAARNSTDDFNAFHDPYKWDRIRNNPFGRPIALGFQLETLAAHRVEAHHQQNGELPLLAEAGLRYSNYQYSFADVVSSGESFAVDVRATSNKITSQGQLVNRVSIRKGRRLVMLGYQRESRLPLTHANADFSGVTDLFCAPDRSFVGDGGYFLKRKFMNTSNAKNFLLGSMVDQHRYFDELEDRVRFPALFPVALVSCALLEKAMNEGYDFYGYPMVYTSHQITVDRMLQEGLRSNDRLHILVRGPESVKGQKGLGKSDIPQTRYDCFGLLDDNRILFRAQVLMALLEHVVSACEVRAGRCVA